MGSALLQLRQVLSGLAVIAEAEEGACKQSQAYLSEEKDLGNLTGNQALNFTTAAGAFNNFKGTLTGNVNWSITPPPAPMSVHLLLTSSGANRTNTWWGGITWLHSASAPAHPAGDGDEALYVFKWTGSRWLGAMQVLGGPASQTIQTDSLRVEDTSGNEYYTLSAATGISFGSSINVHFRDGRAIYWNTTPSYNGNCSITGVAPGSIYGPPNSIAINAAGGLNITRGSSSDPCETLLAAGINLGLGSGWSSVAAGSRPTNTLGILAGTNPSANVTSMVQMYGLVGAGGEVCLATRTSTGNVIKMQRLNIADYGNLATVADVKSFLQALGFAST